MKALSQLGLQIWKYYVLRKRQPILLLLEFLWPVLLFLIVTLVRQSAPPEEKPQCHYAPRSMPSAGIKFIQDFVCNLNNECHHQPVSSSDSRRPKVAEFLKAVEPLYTKDINATNTFLRDLPKTKALVDSIRDSLTRKEVQRVLEMNLVVGDLFKDKEALRNYLVDDLQVLPRDVVNALLDSAFNMDKLYSLTGYLDFVAIVCDPEELQQYLVFSSTVDVSSVSHSLCNVDRGLVPNITEALQQQVDVAAIVKIAAELEALFGDYTASQALEDISSMLGLLDSLQGLQLQPVNLSMIRWLTKLAKFLEQLQLVDTRNIEGYFRLLSELEPLILNLPEGRAVWDHTQLGLHFLGEVSALMQGGITGVNDLQLSLGDLFRNTSGLVDHLDVTFNITEDMLQTVLTLKLDMTKLMEVLWSDPNSICRDSKLVNIFIYPDAESRDKVEQWIHSLCSVDTSTLDWQITNMFDTEHLMEMIDEVRRRRLPQGFNMSVIMSDISDLSETLTSLAGSLNGLLVSRDTAGLQLTLQDFWNGLTSSAALLNGWTDLDTTVRNWTPVLLGIQEYLSPHPSGEILLRILTAYDTLLDLVELNARYLKEIGNLLQEDVDLREAVQVDPGVTIQIITKLLRPSQLQSVIAEGPESLQRMLCNSTSLQQQLDLTETAALNISTISAVLCRGNLSSALETLDMESHLNDVKLQLSNLQSILDGSEDVQFNAVPNATFLFQKTKDVLHYLQHSLSDSVQGLQDTVIQLPQISTRRWTTAFFLHEMVPEVGSALEDTNLWSHIAPAVRAADALTHALQAWVHSSEDIFSNSTQMGRLWYAISNYGPDVIFALSDTLADETARSNLMDTLTSSATDLPTTLCDPDQVTELLLLPPDLPLADLERSLCDLDLATLTEELRELYSGSEHFRLMMEYWQGQAPDTYDKEFDWDALVGSLTELYQNLQATLPINDQGFQTAWNWAELSVALEDLVNALSSLPVTVLSDLQWVVLENVERAVAGHPQMQPVTYINYYFNQILTAVNEDMSNMQAEGISLETLLSSSDRLREAVTSLANSTPSVMTGLTNAVVHPSQFIRKLLTVDFTDKYACRGVSLSDFMTFTDEVVVKDMEHEICDVMSYMGADMGAVMTELREQPLLGKYIESMENILHFQDRLAPGPVSWREVYSKLEQLYTNLEDMTPPSIDLSSLVAEVPGLDREAVEREARNMIERITELDASTVTGLFENFGEIQSLLRSRSDDNSLGARIWNTVEKSALMADAYLEFVNTYLQEILDNGQFTLLDHQNSTELKRLFDALRLMPDIQSFLLKGFTGILADPSKLADLAAVNTSSLCESSETFEAFFPEPEDVDVCVTEIQHTLCHMTSADFPRAVEELRTSVPGLDKFIMMTTTISELDVRSDLRLNLTEFISRFKTYSSLLQQLGQRPVRFDLGLDLSGLKVNDWSDRWQQVMEQLAGWNSQSSRYLTVLEMLDSYFDLGNLYGVFHVWGAIIDTVQEKLDPDAREIRLADLFPESPEVQKLAGLIEDTPDVLEVLLNSYGNPKFQSLLQSNLSTALIMLCHPQSDLEQFLTLTPGSEVNLDLLQSQFCNISLADLETQLVEEFGSVNWRQLALDRSPVNWTALYVKSTELSATLTQINQGQGPGFAEGGSLLDSDRWLKLLQGHMNDSKIPWQELTSGDPFSTVWPLLDTVLQSLSATPSSNVTLAYMKASQMVLEYLNDLFNKVDLSNQVVEIGQLFQNASHVRNVLEVVFDISPDLVSALMQGSVRLDKVLQLASMKQHQMQEVLCDEDKFGHYLNFPASATADVSRLVQTFCGLDVGQLTEELQREFDVAGLIRRLRSLSSGDNSDFDFNITATEHTYNQLLQKIADLAKVTGVSILGQRLESVFDLATFEGLPPALSHLQDMITGSTGQDPQIYVQALVLLESKLNGTQMWSSVRDSLLAAQIYADLLNNKVSTLSNATLTLSDLLQDADKTADFLERTCQTMPEIVQVLMQSRVDLAQLFSSGDMQTAWCGDAVTYPETINPAVVREIFCTVNYTELLGEITDQYDWVTIQQMLLASSDNKIINWTAVVESAMQLQDQLSLFLKEESVNQQALPQFAIFDGDYNSWLQRMNRALQSPSVTDADSLAWLADWLQSQMSDPNLRDVWTSVLPSLNAINILADTLSDRQQTLPVDFTLADVLADIDHTRMTLERVFNVTPQLFDDIALMQFDKLKLTQAAQSANLLEFLCNSNISATLRDLVCQVDPTLITQELREALDWDRVVSQFATVDRDIDPQSFNWTTYLSTLRDLQENFKVTLNSISTLNLTQFFPPAVNLAQLQLELTQMLEQPQGQQNWIDRMLWVFSSLEDILPTLTLTEADKEVKVIVRSLQSVHTVIEAVSNRLTLILNKGSLSLKLLLVDAPKLTNLTQALMTISAETMEVLLNSTVRPEFILSLLEQSPDSLATQICVNGSLHNWLSLPAGGDTGMEELSNALCSSVTDTVRLMDELKQQLNSGKVITQLQNLRTDGDLLVSASNVTLFTESVLNLTQLLIQTIQSPPSVGPGLASLFDLSRLWPLLQQVLVQPLKEEVFAGTPVLSKLLDDLAKSGIWLLQQNGGMKYSLHALSEGMTAALQQLKDDGVTLTSVKTLPSFLVNVWSTFYHKMSDREAAVRSVLPVFNESIEQQPRIKDIVCNVTELRNVFPKRQYLNVTAVSVAVCGQPVSTWYRGLRDAGLIPSDIVIFAAKLWHHYVPSYEVLEVNGTISATLMKAPYTLSKVPDVSWSKVSASYKRMFDLLTPLFDLEGFSKDGLDLGTFLRAFRATGTKDVSVLKIIEDQFLQADSQLTTHTDDRVWEKLKQLSYAAGLTLEYLNGKLEDAMAEGQTPHLVSIFRDADTAKKLLAEVTSPAAARLLLDSALDSTKLRRVSTVKQLQELFCDLEQLNSTLDLDSSTRSAGVVQQQLCTALSDNSTDLLQRLMDELDFNKYYQKLQELLRLGANKMERNPWRLYFNQLTNLLTNAELLFANKTGINTTGLGDWLAGLNTLADPGGVNWIIDRRVDWCEIGMQFLDEMWPSHPVGMVLKQRVKYAEMFARGIQILPEIEELACTMSDMNITTFQKLLQNSSVLTTIEELTGLVSSGNNTLLAPFSCQKFFRVQSQVAESVNYLQTSLSSWWSRTTQCLGGAAGRNVPILQDIDRLLLLLWEGQSLIVEMPDTQGLEALTPYMEKFLDVLLVQKPVFLKFEDLLTNRTQMQTVLTDVLKISPNVTEKVLGSTVNVDLIYKWLYNSSDSQLWSIVCDSDKVRDVFSPFVTPLNVDPGDVTAKLCGPDFNVSMQRLRGGIDLGLVLVQMLQTKPDYSLDTAWLGTVSADLLAVVRSLESILQLSSLADTINPDADIPHILRVLQQFVQDEGPEKGFENVNKLIDDLRPVFSDPESEVVLNDLQTLASGIAGLHVIRKYFGIKVQIRQLIKSPKDLYNYMSSDLELSPKVADAILNSSVSYGELFNIGQRVDIKELLCDEQELGQLLEIQKNASVSIAEISAELCRMDQDTAVVTTQYLLEQLDIGHLISEFIELSPETFLASANLTTDEVRDMMDSFRPFQDNMDNLVTAMNNLSSEVDLPALAQGLHGHGQGPTMMESLGQFLCGSKGAFNFQDEFNLNTERDRNSVPRRIKNGDQTTNYGQTDRVPDMAEKKNKNTTADNMAPTDKYRKYPPYVKKTLDQFKTDFCRDLYLDLVKDANGKIVWTFLKPLLLGKIPFAPDTPVTRAIMQEVQDSMNKIKDLQEFANLWQKTSRELGKVTNMSDTVETIKWSDVVSSVRELGDAIQNPFVAGALSSLLGTESSDLVTQIETLGSLQGEPLQQLQTVAELLSSLIDCMEMDRLEGLESETEVEERAKQLSYSNLVMAAVVFMEEEEDAADTRTRARRAANSSSSSSRGASPHLQLPKHIKYKLRMDVDNTPETTALRSVLWQPDPESSFASNMRYLRGFIILQDMIERAIVRLQTGDADIDTPTVELQQIPFPCYESDYFQLYVSSYFFPIIMTLAWLAVMAMAIRNLVYDREKRLDDTMRAMGMLPGVGWLAWFINTYLGMLLLSLVVTMFLKLGSLMRYSDPVLIFVFLADYSLATTMMCYLISVFFNRTTLAALTGLIIYLISYLPFIILVAMQTELLFWHKVLVSLSATVPFGHGTQLFSQAEQLGVGVSWGNIGDTYSQQSLGDFTLDWTMYMMLIDALLYAVVAWYISHVFPGKYGIAEPWYFCFSAKYWGCRGHTPRHHATPERFSQEGDVEQTNDTVPGEEEPLDLPIGISLHHLSKSYPSKDLAVDNLTANLFSGQITAVLGHNGAGKTTTINMLTGLYPPTYGTAYVNGRDILKESSTIRRDLGICPQHNILFDYMTVYEHLQFYCSLKGNLTSSQKKRDISRMLDLTGLRSSIHVRACHLSGGQARRLSVALAFIGGSRVIILDEPTSGVDPAARRLIWDLIVQHREGRTILLSTHHLDEADILGDRLLVLHQGKLLCSGSPLYLKREFGSGYRLTVAKDRAYSSGSSSTATEVLKRFVCQRIQGSRLVEDFGSELTFVLPTHHGQTANFQKFFKHLHANRANLHVASYGVSDTTLEEVFLKVTLQADQGHPLDAKVLRNMSDTTGNGTDKESGVDAGSSDGPQASQVGNGTNSHPLKGSRKVGGVHLTLRRFRALLTKRFHHNRRDFRSYLSQIILPCFFILLAMACTKIKPSSDHQPALLLRPDLYESSFFRMESEKAGKAKIKTAWHDPGLGTTCMEDTEMRSQCKREFSTWLDTNHTPFEDPPECQCDRGHHECPAAARGPPQPYLYMKTGHRLYDITNSQFHTQDYLLRTHKDFIMDRYGGWSFDTTNNGNLTSSRVTVWYNNKGWHSAPSYFNAYNNMLLRDAIAASGGSPAKYGISVYNHPLSLSKEQLNTRTLLQNIAEAGIALTILCAFCFVPAGYTIYLISEHINKEKHMQFVCGVGVMSYWTTAWLWDMLNYMLTVGLAALIALVFDIPIYTARLNMLAFIMALTMFGWATIPLMYVLVRGFKQVSTGYMAMFILNLLIGITTTACVFLLTMFIYRQGIAKAYQITSKAFLVFPQFCLGDSLMRLSHNQLASEIYQRFEIDNYRNPFGLDMIGWHLVAMFLEGIACFLLLLLLEYQPWSRTRSPKYVSQNDKKPASDYKEDEDVSLERQRVVTGEAREDVLVMHGLKKTYRRGFKKVLAVDNISVGIPQGECFGLLGVNGAGKTTTFDMVTGDILPTKGAALLMNKMITGKQSNIHQDIGYCPQFDALDTRLTGQELVYCYARLKGIPEQDIPGVCDAAVAKVGLQQYVKETVHNYSGGTKRKLSAVLALLGEPRLVMLDEPTTGMDPQTRRLVWNNILQVIKQDRSVVLTSHSMAECDALCTRMAIMVNGRFICLGSGQHLKHKFGSGYTVTLRIGGSPPDLDTVAGFMYTTFQGTVLKDCHRNMLEFEIPYHSAQLSEIFGCLEREKETYNIVDYSVHQTTLDQVFLNFARDQSDGNQDPEEADEENELEGPGDHPREAYIYSNSAYDSTPDSLPPGHQYRTNVQQAAETKGKQEGEKKATSPTGSGHNPFLPRSGLAFRPPFMRDQADKPQSPNSDADSTVEESTHL